MKFRPCIDIHNGKVKQIVGSSLRDLGDFAADNFVSELDGGFYGRLYRKHGLSGGHIILLNDKKSSYYRKDLEQARLALSAYPGGMQIGGGVTAENAAEFLDMGASHVIVTSYVFQNGRINYGNLEKILRETGKDHLTLDLSCKKREGKYYIVTDRWQNDTDVSVTPNLLSELSAFCDEFLIHAADVEGKSAGVEENLIRILGSYQGIPVTYAGGIRSQADIERISRWGQNRLDFTVGSALDLFGGSLSFEMLIHHSFLS